MKKILTFITTTLFGSLAFGQATKADSTATKVDSLMQSDTIVLSRKVLPSELKTVPDSLGADARQGQAKISSKDTEAGSPSKVKKTTPNAKLSSAPQKAESGKRKD